MAQGVTAHKAIQCKPESLNETIPRECFHGILGTTRRIEAPGGEQERHASIQNNKPEDKSVHTVSFLRPFALLRFKTSRPECDFIRLRNPWARLPLLIVGDFRVFFMAEDCSTQSFYVNIF